MNRSVAFSSVLLATTMLSSSLALAQEGDAGVDEAGNEVIVVRGEFIPEPQRATSQVATFLTDSDLERTGDANAAVALTRLSGLSIVSNRFAYVRGLGERYSLAMLNGSHLPSPEPLRRTIPLDLFPADLLDGITVQKTFSARYPGDFGGGVIELRTLREAREDYLKLSASIGVNSVNIEEDGIYVHGTDIDWTGYDDGLRKIPPLLQDVFASNMRLDQFDDGIVELAGESLVNSPLSVIQEGDLGPNGSFSIEGARNFATPRYNLGLVGVVGHDQSWTTENSVRQVQDNGALGLDLTTVESTLNASVNALGSAALTWGDQALQSTVLYVHTTAKEAQIDQGADFNAPFSGIVHDESSGWFERELAMLQLSGAHYFGPFELGWRAALAESNRDAPYERRLRRIRNTDGVPAYLQANQYRIRFSELTDTVVSGGIDGAYNFNIGDSRDGTITLGVDQSSTERDFRSNEVFFTGGNALPADVQVARPDFLFSPDNIDPSRFVLRERLSPSDSHIGELDVMAAFAEADLELIPFVRTTLGVRYEEAEQEVRTFNRLGAQGDDAFIANDYVLPSALITWNFAEDLQLRLGYSQTIARPQFRELAESIFLDPDTDRVYRGNSDLQDSEFKNYDARLEYYMGRDAFVTLAGFYKDIERPIEEILFSTSTFVYESRFINSPSATLYGGEFEFRRYFESPFRGPWFDSRTWRAALNYTYTSSEVHAEAGDTILDPTRDELVDASLFGIDGEPLQGTPENIVNLQLGWESEHDELTLLVGWVDERVLQRGEQSSESALPDVVEDPGVQLDLVFRRFFELRGAEVTLGIEARNLLDEQHIEFQDSEAAGVTQFNTYDRGRSLSVSLSSRF